MDVVWGTVLAIELMIKVTRSINRLCKVDDDGHDGPQGGDTETT